MAQRNEHTSEQTPPLHCDVLLVTATGVETQAVIDVFPHPNAALKRYDIGESTYFDLGIIGISRIFLVQTEMGSVGPAGASLVVYEGIKALSPSAVIQVGIAFGLIPQEQHLGEILVSRQLSGYELQKIEQDSNGNEIIRPRGDRVQPSPRLLSRLRAGIFDWDGAKVHFGLMLSGEKVVNHKGFRKKLLNIEPEAVGGEMEGTGVYSAANRTKVDWILVKAIADWADGDKNDMFQQNAAQNAARFLFHVLQQGELIKNDVSEFPASQTFAEPTERKQVAGPIPCTYGDHASWVIAVGWEPDGNRIASAGGDGVVRVWDATSTRTVLTYRGHKWLFKNVNWLPKIYVVAWSPEGLRVASAGDGRKVYVWDATTGQTITEYDGHIGVLSNVFTLAWSPDGKRIASACSTAGVDKTVHVWNATGGNTLLRCDASYGFMPNFSVSSLAWSPQDDRIAAACGDKTIRLWNAANGQLISKFKTSSAYVYTLAWSPDGQYVALANANSTAEILNASTGQILLTYHGHNKEVRDIAWSPDGSHLATASNDTTVQIWDAHTATSLYTYTGHDAWTTSVAWSPDGTYIASASNDKTVQVWRTV